MASLEDDMRNAEDAMLHSAERHFDALEETFDTNDTVWMVCPYCGFEDRDSDEVRPDSGTHDCPECGETYNFERNKNIRYDTWEV
jgi:predicted RNA-binding Zn-ribbon protein involved in translation (DUF1610 family)